MKGNICDVKNSFLIYVNSLASLFCNFSMAMLMQPHSGKNDTVDF